MIRTIVFSLMLMLALAAVAEQPRSFEDQMREAQKLLRSGKADDAIKAFKKAIKRQNSPEAFLGLAQAYTKTRAYKDAVETCQKALSFATDDTMKARLHFEMAKAYEAFGDQKKDKLQDAEREYRDAIKLAPGTSAIHFTLGRVLMKQNRDPEGTDELKRYLADTNGDDRYVQDAERYIANPRRARELYIPEFSMTTVDGRYVSTGDLLGKIVVLDFWATWCAPCRASVPELKDIVKRFANDPVVVISISSDEDDAKWRAFIEKNQMTWPQYRDSDNHVLSAFGIHSFPTYVVVDAEGIMRKVEVGAGGGQVGDIADAVKKNLKLLAETKAKSSAGN